VKAVYLIKKKEIKIEEIPVPEIKSKREVLVKIKCVGICGSDIHYFLEGKIGNQIVEDKIILGHEAAGEVVETGDDVKAFKPGDKVAVDPGISCGNCDLCKKGKPNLCPYVEFLGTPPVDGAFREYLVMPEENLVKIPEGLGYEEGVLSEPLAIGLYGVRLSGMKVGDDVAILGQGPIGLSALFSAKMGGAKKIFVSDLLPPRLEMAKKLGADNVINASKEDVTAIIMKKTGGKGVDIAYEAAGEPETFRQITETARIGGKSVIFGIPSDDKMEFSAHVVRRKELNIINVRRSAFATSESLELMGKSNLPFSHLVTHRFALKDVEDALNLVAEYKDGVIKAVINFGE